MREEKEAEDAPPRVGPAECVAPGGTIGGCLIRLGLFLFEVSGLEDCAYKRQRRQARKRLGALESCASLGLCKFWIVLLAALV